MQCSVQFSIIHHFQIILNPNRAGKAVEDLVVRMVGRCSERKVWHGLWTRLTRLSVGQHVSRGASPVCQSVPHYPGQPVHQAAAGERVCRAWGHLRVLDRGSFSGKIWNEQTPLKRVVTIDQEISFLENKEHSSFTTIRLSAHSSSHRLISQVRHRHRWSHREPPLHHHLLPQD